MYRAEKNGLQNIVRQDPGRARQDRFGTAGTKFSQPRTEPFSALYKRLYIFVRIPIKSSNHLKVGNP